MTRLSKRATDLSNGNFKIREIARLLDLEKESVKLLLAGQAMLTPRDQKRYQISPKLSNPSIQQLGRHRFVSSGNVLIPSFSASEDATMSYVSDASPRTEDKELILEDEEEEGLEVCVSDSDSDSDRGSTDSGDEERGCRGGRGVGHVSKPSSIMVQLNEDGGGGVGVGRADHAGAQTPGDGVNTASPHTDVNPAMPRSTKPSGPEVGKMSLMTMLAKLFSKCSFWS